jgi:hypothetical protein
MLSLNRKERTHRSSQTVMSTQSQRDANRRNAKNPPVLVPKRQGAYPPERSRARPARPHRCPPLGERQRICRSVCQTGRVDGAGQSRRAAPGRTKPASNGSTYTAADSKAPCCARITSWPCWKSSAISASSAQSRKPPRPRKQSAKLSQTPQPPAPAEMETAPVSEVS